MLKLYFLFIHNLPASPGRATSQLFPVGNISSDGFNQIVFKTISDTLVLIKYRLYPPNLDRSATAFNEEKP